MHMLSLRIALAADIVAIRSITLMLDNQYLDRVSRAIIDDDSHRV